MRVSKTGFLIAEGMRGLVRHRGLTLAALLSSVASYSILAAFLVVGWNLRSAVSEVAARKEIVVFIRDSVPDDSMIVLARAVRGMPGVGAVRYVDKAEALAELKADLGEAQDLVQAIGANPLPRSIRVGLTPEARVSDRIAALADTIGTVSGVEDVRYGEEWVSRLDLLVRRARTVLLVVGGLVTVAALFVVLSTIRLAVIARRDLVEVLRLVGASGAFVRGPFLVEGVISSVLAMAIALTVAWGLTFAAIRWVPGLVFLPLRAIAAAALFALLIGLLGSLLALANVLRGTAPSR